MDQGDGKKPGGNQGNPTQKTVYLGDPVNEIVVADPEGEAQFEPLFTPNPGIWSPLELNQYLQGIEFESFPQLEPEDDSITPRGIPVLSAISGQMIVGWSLRKIRSHLGYLFGTLVALHINRLIRLSQGYQIQAHFDFRYDVIQVRSAEELALQWILEENNENQNFLELPEMVQNELRQQARTDARIMRLGEAWGNVRFFPEKPFWLFIMYELDIPDGARCVNWDLNLGNGTVYIVNMNLFCHRWTENYNRDNPATAESMHALIDSHYRDDKIVKDHDRRHNSFRLDYPNMVVRAIQVLKNSEIIDLSPGFHVYYTRVCNCEIIQDEMQNQV